MSDSADKAPSISISKDVLAAHLDGEAVLLHLETKQYYRLNETGAFIWKCFEKGLDTTATTARLVEEFEVDAATAETELQRVLTELRARNLVIEP